LVVPGCVTMTDHWPQSTSQIAIGKANCMRAAHNKLNSTGLFSRTKTPSCHTQKYNGLHFDLIFHTRTAVELKLLTTHQTCTVFHMSSIRKDLRLSRDNFKMRQKLCRQISFVASTTTTIRPFATRVSLTRSSRKMTLRAKTRREEINLQNNLTLELVPSQQPRILHFCSQPTPSFAASNSYYCEVKTNGVTVGNGIENLYRGAYQ